MMRRAGRRELLLMWQLIQRAPVCARAYWMMGLQRYHPRSSTKQQPSTLKIAVQSTRKLV
eukprot:1778256-Amphidinium_carterae.1